MGSRGCGRFTCPEEAQVGYGVSQVMAAFVASLCSMFPAPPEPPIRLPTLLRIANAVRALPGERFSRTLGSSKVSLRTAIPSQRTFNETQISLKSPTKE